MEFLKEYKIKIEKGTASQADKNNIKRFLKEYGIKEEHFMKCQNMEEYEFGNGKMDDITASIYWIS